MTDEKKDLEDKIVKSVKVAIAGGTAAVAISNPIVGIIAAGLSTAICEVLPNFKQKNFDYVLSQLSIELINLKDEIDTEFINNDKFAYLLNKGLKLAIDEIDKTKITAYINILTHSITNPEEFKKIDFYLSVLQSLDNREVHTLAFFNNPRAYLRFREINEEEVADEDLLGVLKKSVPELTMDEFRIILNSLHSRGLINSEADTLTMGTSTRGLEMAIGRLTNSGKSLIKYCSNYEDGL